ncbi:MAG: HNH endonuclease [Verrucomicrobiales bacterium]|nr:HNH endonuclease [Verrucomicrobiales bacterium]
MRSPDPYRYPAMPHVRRHGPGGYANYGAYRSWLRDEFDFRCVYCLQRERWGQVSRSFELDHFLPQALREDLELEYDNLVYTCASCNGAKSSRLVPDPHVHAFGACLRVEDSGVITALNDQGIYLIDELDLDSFERTEWRKTIIETISLVAKSGGPDLLKQWMGLPTELPNLSSLRPPIPNTRSAGIKNSWHSRIARGEQIEVFE